MINPTKEKLEKMIRDLEFTYFYQKWYRSLELRNHTIHLTHAEHAQNMVKELNEAIKPILDKYADIIRKEMDEL